MSEKTEQPTAKRLREARRKGQVPRSRVFSAAVIVAAGLGTLRLNSPSALRRLTALTAHALSAPLWAPLAALAEAGSAAAWLLVPPLFAAVVASLCVGFATAGWQVELGALAPSLERLKPDAGKLFSRRKLLEVLKGAAISVALMTMAWSAALVGAGPLLRGVLFPEARAGSTLLPFLEPLLDRCCAVALALGVGDFLLARRRHRRELMMSREETRREHKESEGDPRHKGKRRSLHRQLTSGGPARGARQASVIIVNPTHLAVALRYRPEECDAPYIVARGREQEALAIRVEAAHSRIPIIRDIWLARSLIHFDVGEEIPEELYEAAAVVLKVAFEASPEKERR